MTNEKLDGARSAWSGQKETSAAAAELIERLGTLDAVAIVFFCSHRHDGARISRALRDRYTQAQVVGCTTAGEFANGGHGTEGVSALAFGPAKVKRSAAALVRCEEGSAKGVTEAVAALSKQLGVASLRELDPKRHVGVVLIEGLKMREEEINEHLGNQAPLLSFVGGSAGDNLEFKETRVFSNAVATNDGATLLVLEMAVPFAITKTCSFETTGKSWTVTKVDEKLRTIYELDGRPVAHVYAEALGIHPGKLDSNIFRSNPMGLMIDGKPWIRSPQQLLPDGGLRFYCKVSEGMTIHLMRSTDLVADTVRAMADAPRALGATPAGVLAFNCILRRLELDAKNAHAPFLKAFSGLQMAGFHTYGESYLGHINQTFTGLLFA